MLRSTESDEPIDETPDSVEISGTSGSHHETGQDNQLYFHIETVSGDAYRARINGSHLGPRLTVYDDDEDEVVYMGEVPDDETSETGFEPDYDLTSVDLGQTEFSVEQVEAALNGAFEASD